MLTKEEIRKLKKEMDSSYRPLVFFHDDTDGLCSFLQIYTHIGDGKGVIVKSHPNVDMKFINKVEEYCPDTIFAVDLAKMEQEFIDKAHKRIVWIDHHEPLKRHNVKYFNPRINNPTVNTAASQLIYETLKEDLWIAMCGIVGDWQFPEHLAKEFSEQYPDLLPKTVKKPEKALFETKLGRLIRIMNFVLKGKTQDVMKCVKILTRISNPYEIINQETPRGKFIYKRYEQIAKEYDKLLKQILDQKQKEKIILFTYKSDTMSFTGDISNELLYRFPNKVIIIGREKSGEMKCSLRSGRHTQLSKIVKKALEDVDGYGGGHEHACGAAIKLDDFEKFIKNIESQL